MGHGVQWDRPFWPRHHQFHGSSEYHDDRALGDFDDRRSTLRRHRTQCVLQVHGYAVARNDSRWRLGGDLYGDDPVRLRVDVLNERVLGDADNRERKGVGYRRLYSHAESWNTLAISNDQRRRQADQSASERRDVSDGSAREPNQPETAHQEVTGDQRVTSVLDSSERQRGIGNQSRKSASLRPRPTPRNSKSPPAVGAA
jgi:hypothetical protein